MYAQADGDGSMPNNLDTLERLLKARRVCVRLVTDDETYALELVRDAAFAMMRPVWRWSVIQGVCEGVTADGDTLSSTEHAAAAMFAAARLNGPIVFVTLDLADHLGDAKTLRAWREALHSFERSGSQMVMIEHGAELPPVVQRLVTTMELALPDDEILERIVRKTIKDVRRSQPIEAKLTRDELQTIIKNLRGLTRRQAKQVILECIADDDRFEFADLGRIMASKRRMLHVDGLLEYIETPTSLDQIGGMRRLKRWLGQRQLAVTDRAREFGISPPRGVMMLGVQGAGKSLCAKAIATAWQRPLLRLDPSVLYDKYIGESERRLRDALAQAEAMSPVVLWIDEIEKGFASAAGQSTDGGLSRRMFGTLLTWMQEHEEPVFMVATANDIESLPPELMRKGRFDEIFFVDLPGVEAREQIFRIHLKKRGREPDQFDLPKLVAASDGYSGAEIEQAIISALHAAFSGEGEDISTLTVLDAIVGSPPLSVTMAERVQALRDWAEGRCVPAD